MNKQIIIRLRSPEGQNRLTVKSGDTFGEVIIQIAKTLNYSLKDLIMQTDEGRMLSVPEGKKIYDVPYFKDGAIVKVSSRNPKKPEAHQGMGVSQLQTAQNNSKCNHPEGGKCLNCIGGPQDKDGKKDETESKPRCNHGPGGRCFNCTSFDPKDKEAQMKWLCQHGPHAKCVHCLDKEFISDTAHISFDQFIQDKKLKCKGVHPAEVKCGNCLPPSEIRYEVDRTCKNHDPYPKAMCNKCIPSSVVIKRQEFRHVDYVQFMNVDALSRMVKFWVQKKHMAEQRVGFLYGYFAEDPHYKGGIRVIVEAIYEPKQKGTYNTFEILQSPDELAKIDRIAEAGLGLQKIGWIYTENNHDVVMSQSKVRMAARYQQQNQVRHNSGYMISNFITVILRNDEKHNGEVKPEVYMISDQGQALERCNLFEDTVERKMMKVRTPKNPQEGLPPFICGGKNVTEFEPEFLLVKIAHGSSRSNKFAFLKGQGFPAKNQEGATKKDLKEYLKVNKHKASHIKYGEFNLLVYLADIIDIGTAITLANTVPSEDKVPEALDDFVHQFAEL